MVTEEEKEPFPTMVTNENGWGEQEQYEMAKVRKKKETVWGRREENVVRKKKPKRSGRESLVFFFKN